MNGRIRLTLLLAVSLLLLCGCTAKISHYSLLSTENVDLGMPYVKIMEDATAATSSLWVLLYFGIDNPSYYKAIGDCLAQYDGDLMTDVEVTTTSYWFIIGFYTEFRVAGDVWKLADEVTAATADPANLYTLNTVDGRQLLVSGDGRDQRPVTTARF